MNNKMDTDIAKIRLMTAVFSEYPVGQVAYYCDVSMAIMIETRKFFNASSKYTYSEDSWTYAEVVIDLYITLDIRSLRQHVGVSNYLH